MPSYCQNTPPVNSVPPVEDMELFKPYFEIPDGCTSFTVYIKVSSNNYRVTGHSPGYPPDGPCGAPGDLNCMIDIDESGSGSSDVISCTLDYDQDPTGEHINIYVQDMSIAGGETKGHSASGETVR